MSSTSSLMAHSTAFDNKVYQIIKSKGSLGAVQQTRASSDDLTPAYSKVRDTSSYVNFTSGKWELTGVYGTKELTIDSCKGYFTFIGDSVMITIDSFGLSGGLGYTLDLTPYIGNCTFQRMIGQAFTNNGIYQREVGASTPATIHVNNTKLDISCNGNVKINFTMLYKINDFETIKGTCANDNLSFEYLRTT